MVVCHCERINERHVSKAVRSGCSSVRAVAAATGAGRGCGGCVPSLKRIIEEHFGRLVPGRTADEAA